MFTQPQIVEVHSPDEAEEMAIFFKTIWAEGVEVVPFDLILAAQHVGGYAVLAKQNDLIVGASFGFRGTFRGANILHSHVTAATVPGVGFEIKRHQFDWAKEQDLTGITWTFDPLVRRNCVFNFEKLGAVAVQYEINFYGAMADSINAGDDSDRLFAYWSTQSQMESSKGINHETAIRNISGKPQLVTFDSSKPFWVELPEDIETIRKSDMSLALEWRGHVRNVLQPALAKGALIRAMKPDRTAILIEPFTAGVGMFEF
jgi:predicted GNAT superfamily acetyltransferase